MEPSKAPPTRGKSGRQTVIPVVAEQLEVGKKAVTTGTVRVRKTVQEKVEHLDVPLLHDTVEVRRETINRVVDEPPPIREEGSTIIIPVVEEELVVAKRLVLKEEVHLIRRRTQTHSAQDVTLQREEAEVEHLDAEGRPRLPKAGS